MNNEDRRDMVACVAEGVTRALVHLKIVEEVEHPITGKPVVTKTLGKFSDEVKRSPRKRR